MGQSSFGTQDRRKAINWAFLSSVASILFSSPYIITLVDLRQVQMASEGVFTATRSQPKAGGVSPSVGSTKELRYSANQ
jgi:hypothetical protein